MPSHVIVKEEKTLAAGGGSVVFYLPKELRSFLSPGDKVSLQAEMMDGIMRILVEKKIFNFSLQDIKNLAKEFFLQTRYEGNLEGTIVFDAASEYLSLKYLESGLDKPPNLGRVILSTNLSITNPEAYSRLVNAGEGLSKQGFDLLIQPEGDLDSVNLIEHPEYYKLKNQEEAIARLQKAGRKVVFSVSSRADNMHYQLDQLKGAMSQLKKIRSDF
ncbi:MAG: hypothetical protein ACRECH_07820 [Nitrososphaerales archaeon]